MKILTIIFFFFFGLFSKEILNTIKKMSTKLCLLCGGKIENNYKFNNLLKNFFINILPSNSFWIKLILILFVFNIFYHFIVAGYFFYFYQAPFPIFAGPDVSLHLNVISDGGNVPIQNIQNTVNNSTLNVNAPITVPGVAEGAIAAGAIKAGIEIAKRIPSPAGKIVGGALATLAVTAAAKIGGKTGDIISNSLDNTSNVTKFLPSFELFIRKVEGLDKYPLNLLEDMSLLNTLSISFLFLILNSLIAIYIKDKDIFVYLPKNIKLESKLGKFIKLMVNRYINIWYVSSKFVLILSIIMLLFCLLVNKFGFMVILASG
jgi:hypothetical protein